MAGIWGGKTIVVVVFLKLDGLIDVLCSSNRLDWIFCIIEKNSSSGGTVIACFLLLYFILLLLSMDDEVDSLLLGSNCLTEFVRLDDEDEEAVVARICWDWKLLLFMLLLLLDEEDDEIMADEDDEVDDEADEVVDEVDEDLICVMDVGCNREDGAMLLRWSSNRVRWDLIIKLKKSSFGIVLPNLPTKFDSFMFMSFSLVIYLPLLASLKSSFLIRDAWLLLLLILAMRLIEQRWSSKRFDWMRESTSKNDNSLFSSLLLLLLVFVSDVVVFKIWADDDDDDEGGCCGGNGGCVNLFSTLSIFVREKFKFFRWKFIGSSDVVAMWPLAFIPLLTRNGCGCGCCCWIIPAEADGGGSDDGAAVFV